MNFPVTDLTMQDALSRLSTYWSARGCVMVQPMNTEVGAGTLNPATALRVLGPEPWRVAYAEPSVRPDDARYGENPNRIQCHTQFQVILKPEPGDAQELYLGSLIALGIDITKHDVRFVEDNWASPALGAWGLGWEVWLDGLEITQFTYFQQAGGINLNPPSVEITYGMERILMALQGVRHFKDITYAPGLTYGELFGQAEYEMSRYYLDDADVAANRSLLDLYAGEAQKMIDAALPVPAHSFVLKMSHAFNVLDARGAVSTADRATEFARMRKLSHAVATLWIATREKAGYPLCQDVPVIHQIPQTEHTEPSTGLQTLVFEIGVEEMPPHEARNSASYVRETLTAKLSAGRLAYGEITVVATPRRITAIVQQVAERETDLTRTVRGPRTSAAYAADGTATKAAEGFARANQVSVAELETIEDSGIEYVAVQRHESGRAATETLAPVLADIVSGMRSGKNMRWSDPSLSFTRPIRWLLALWGNEIVPATVSGLRAGRTTYVHRAASQPAVDIATAGDYLSTLDKHGILADAATRRMTIIDGASKLASTVDGRVDLDAEDVLIEQVCFLVEQPTAILGHYDHSYMSLPEPVLTAVMRKHQRYLPVRAADGSLLPYFVVIANGPIDVDTVRGGNEAVLRARFEDAAFFHRADLATPLEAMRINLSRLTFTEHLGSMSDRAQRISNLAEELAAHIALSPADREVLKRAGHLAKFDLGSQMVTEMTSLAGVMAREYATAAGESATVAQAIFETELPRQTGDLLPASSPGALLSLADRLDSLVGLAATVGLPTGSSDPFALRRAALGAIAVHRHSVELESLSLHDGLRQAASMQPVPVEEKTLAAIEEFLARRLEQQLLDEGRPIDRVRAAIIHANRPHRVDEILTQLAQFADQTEFLRLTAALQRARRIVPSGSQPKYNPEMLTSAEEQHLHREVGKAGAALKDHADLANLIAATTDLPDAVDQFFDAILVMADDPAVRAQRIGLVAAVAALGAGYLDWEALRV